MLRCSFTPSQGGSNMYNKPMVERFGTFRELTQSGFGGAGDGCIVLDPINNTIVNSNPNDGTVEPFCNEPGVDSPTV